jgi:alkanesulfonate monooxygenase SsuD/methylene tetrahydromethanopterin reductase-like flavin-dependent oxidoreductase (luciferase family)
VIDLRAADPHKADMDFGIFDHLDRYDIPLAQFYAERLQLVAQYDAAGFYSYHLAEHHATPLGMAPSPSVFLAAVAAHTRRLRFGPLVYALPLYHPLRLIEEICMLDQMSGGRLDIGFGRGASPIELALFGEDPAAAEPTYVEALELVINGLTQKAVTFHGNRFHFDNVPMWVEPLQRPHPPIWYGVHSAESAERAARQGLNTVSLDGPAQAKITTERYREVWREQRGDAPLPKLGIGRFIVVADSDGEAMALARRAYPKWNASFTHLFRAHGRSPRHPRPDDFDGVMEAGQGIAGAPDTVARYLRNDAAEVGANYIVGQFAFGDLTLAECRRSIQLFADDVMPALRVGRIRMVG